MALPQFIDWAGITARTARQVVEVQSVQEKREKTKYALIAGGFCGALVLLALISRR